MDNSSHPRRDMESRFMFPHYSLGFNRFPHLKRHNDEQASATKAVMKRVPSSTAVTSATSSCVSNADRNTCELPSGRMSLLPIALGIIVPIIAIVVFFILHRKYKKRLRAEDKLDAEKYRSMDFGMGLDYNMGGNERTGRAADVRGKHGPETRQMKGISMDPGQTLLGLNTNRDEPSESFIEEDRYKVVKIMESRSVSRSASPIPTRQDPNMTKLDSNMTKLDSNSSQISISDHPSPQYDGHVRLMAHAQPPGISLPPRGDSRRLQIEPQSCSPSSLAPSIDSQGIQFPCSNQLPSQPMPAVTMDTWLSLPSIDVGRDSYFGNGSKHSRQSKNSLHDFLTDSLPAAQHTVSSASSIVTESFGSTTLDPRSHSNSLKTVISSVADEESRYGSSIRPSMTMDKKSDDHLRNQRRETSRPCIDNNDGAATSSKSSRRELDLPTQSIERLVTPHDNSSSDMPRHYSLKASVHNYTPDHESEVDCMPTFTHYSNPTPQRTIVPPREQSLAQVTPGPLEDRTRGTKKKPFLLAPAPAQKLNHRLSVLMRPLPREDPHESSEERANRIRSFYKEYFDDSKPFTSQIPLPSSDAAYYEDYHSEYLSAGTCYDFRQHGFVVATAPFAEPITRRAMTPPPRAPPRLTNSGLQPRNHTNGDFLPRSDYPPRGQSSMSNHPSPIPISSSIRGQSQASSRKPLAPPKILTSLPSPHLLKDDGAIFNAGDFAPPPSFRDLQNGKRPDSPLGSPRPYSPTIRPFVPLNSSFDDLPTMPSPYMLNESSVFNTLEFAPRTRFRQDDANAVPSISNGRSCISPQGYRAVQSGAYRMSRVPKHLIGTKDDIMAGLKPQWDLRGPG